MIHLALCDDNVEFQRMFRNALENYCSQVFPPSLRFDILKNFGSAEEVLKYIKDHTIDVLFLDIDMPGIGGLELAKRMMLKNENTVIVFVSGYDHYVYEVFEFSPFAFLRKDRIFNELPKTLSRIADRFDKANTDVKIMTVDGICTICARDVMYVSTKGNYYTCFFKNDTHLTCRGTLNDAEQIFCQFDFIRVHAAFLVNLHHIQKYEKSHLYVGSDSIKIPIAQRRLVEFKQAYAQYTMRSFQL